MLRIISGKYRHLIIEAPTVNTTKPTTDKVREALMSALSGDLPNSIILDLFAGSGALGLEALSRGAKQAFFCDNNFIAYKTIKKNIEKLNVTEDVTVFKSSYLEALQKIKETNIKLDIVFLDPPYAKENIYVEVVNYLWENDLLSTNAVIVKEWNKSIPIDYRFSFHKEYIYGTIHILIERR